MLMLSKMIEERISMMNDGVLFIINDFIDIASYDTIKKNFQRLMKRNVIFKVIDGIYMKPKYSDIIGSLVPCSVYDLADCIARKQGWDIIPTGEVAINYFGLSTQLQATYVYSSSGPYRDIVYGKSTISFRHTASKKLANMSKKVQYLVQAINYYGKKTSMIKLSVY